LLSFLKKILELEKGLQRELLVSEPDIRLAIINAVLRDVATKEDVERLRSGFNSFRKDIYSQFSEFRERYLSLREPLHS